MYAVRFEFFGLCEFFIFHYRLNLHTFDTGPMSAIGIGYGNFMVLFF